MIKPPYLTVGDKIGIVAPARWIDQEKYQSVVSIIESYGFEVVRGKTTYLEHGPFAGSDLERLVDMQNMLDNTGIKAVFCLRGGYGTIRIIENLDFTKFSKNPKWLIGFSDITILHNALYNLQFCSIHGQMPLNFSGRSENRGLDKLFAILKGENLSYTLKGNINNRLGTAKAVDVGGNVAILCSLIGTNYDLDTDGKILFIEEVGEYLYRFDRLMHHLKMSGKLANLAGLVVGGLSEMKDNDPDFKQNAEEIIKDLVTEYNYPVCFGFPAGHIKENFPLVFGTTVSLVVSEKLVTLTFDK